MDRNADHLAQPPDRSLQAEAPRNGQPLPFYSALLLARKILQPGRLSQVGLEQVVIYRVRKLLARAEVSFGGLNRGVAQEELDLLEISPRSTAQLGAGTPEVVRGQLGQARPGGVERHNVPD